MGRVGEGMGAGMEGDGGSDPPRPPTPHPPHHHLLCRRPLPTTTAQSPRWVRGRQAAARRRRSRHGRPTLRGARPHTPRTASPAGRRPASRRATSTRAMRLLIVGAAWRNAQAFYECVSASHQPCRGGSRVRGDLFRADAARAHQSVWHDFKTHFFAFGCRARSCTSDNAPNHDWKHCCVIS